MTIETSYDALASTGNGVTTQFPISGPFAATEDVRVTLYDTDAVAYVSAPPVLNGGGTYDYTITASVDATGIYPAGTVTFNTAPLANHTVYRQRVTAATQDISLTSNGPFPAKAVEGALDRPALEIGEVQASLARALRFDPRGPRLTALTVQPFKGKVLGFDPTTGVPIPVLLTPATLPAPYGAFHIDVLTQYGATKAAMLAALAQAALAGGGCKLWLQPNGPAGYDWEDGDFGAILTDNICIEGETGATIINITQNTVGPLFEMSGSGQALIGLTIVYDPTLTSMVGPTVLDNGSTDLIVDVHTVNGPAGVRILESHRAYYNNLIGENWRPSVCDQQDWFLVNFAKSLHIYHPKMTSEEDGIGDSFLAFRATHFTQTIDTVLVEFTAGGAAPNAQAYGLVLDCTGGPIVNVWFNKGVFDRATTAGIYITSGVGGKSLQNVHMDGLHVAPYGAPCLWIDWQTDDNLGDLVISNPIFVAGTFGQSTAIPIIIDAPNDLGLFKGPQINGGTIVNVSKISDAGDFPDCVIQSNASFWMHGTNYELRDTDEDESVHEQNKSPTYFLKETGDFDYIISGCKIEGVTTENNFKFVGRTMPYVIANNVGLYDTAPPVVTGTTTLDANTKTVFLDSSGGAFTVTLPASPGDGPDGTGQEILFKDITGMCGTNGVTVGGTIDGVVNPVINGNHNFYKVKHSKIANKWGEVS
jgi:hypothetical protein